MGSLDEVSLSRINLLLLELKIVGQGIERFGCFSVRDTVEQIEKRVKLYKIYKIRTENGESIRLGEFY